MIAAQYVHDHVMHFYHLHALDWVDVVSALKRGSQGHLGAGPVHQQLFPKSSPGYFSDVQKKLKAFVESGQLGIFSNGYWGHPAYKLPPEANLMAVAHYLDALAWQRDVAQAADHLRRQESAPQLPGGRHAVRHQHPSRARAGARGRIIAAVPAPRLEHDRAARCRRSSLRCAISSTRSMSPTRWPSPVSTRTGRSQGEGIGNFMTYGDFPDQGHGRYRAAILVPAA
jgi:hydrogenase large subunit